MTYWIIRPHITKLFTHWRNSLTAVKRLSITIIGTINSRIDALNKGLKEQLIKIEADAGQKFLKHDEQLKELRNQNEKLRDELAILHKEQKKNNLFVLGIAVEKTIKKETVADLFQNHMHSTEEENDLKDTYSLGKSEKSPILVEFTTFEKKTEILKSAFKLKGTGIYIAEDLLPEQRQKNSLL
ncbi:hypothetical protein HHI36_013173 [Cryptolaemus montrouzieri]|uniref:Uncharacterized protein n=1 Tax=Cryptolaemus montrouzieri TaxID=559131 RepID=A0ABD2NGJ2_9CUCU